MPISTDLLDDGEDVLVDLRPHWSFFVWPLTLSTVAVAIIVLVVHQFPSAPVAVAWILGVLVAVPCLWLAGRLARWFGTSLVVTDRRLVLRTGVLGRRVTNLRLQRIVDIHCSQRPIERLIGSGRLVIEVEGQEGSVALDDVRRPRTLQRVLTRQLDQLDSNWSLFRSPSTEERVSRSPERDDVRRSDLTPPSGVRIAPPGDSAAASIPSQIVALDQLRRQGILSEEEFAAKKAELLRRI